MNDPIKQFSLNVQKCCRKKGISQEELAKRTQLDPKIIKGVFNAKHDAMLDEIDLIAEALGVYSFQLILPDGYEAFGPDGARLEDI